MTHPLLSQTASLLAEAPFSWAVCGGFALELFLGRETRPHGDIDLCAREADRASIVAFMQGQGWQVYEFRGMGKMRLLDANALSEPGRNLMCVLPGCPLVEFFPSDEAGLLWHQFHHSGIRELNYLEFLFSPCTDDGFIFSANPPIPLPMDKAFLKSPEGIPFLAPELALLYKAARPEEGNAASDFQAVFPALDNEQKSWYLSSLHQLYPEGHPWLMG